jgi:hypothetical protein
MAPSRLAIPAEHAPALTESDPVKAGNRNPLIENIHAVKLFGGVLDN